jgi:hypothetical protein
MTVKDRTSRGLAALAVLQSLHLLDELRTDEAADLAGVLLRPQPVIGIGGTIAALVLVRRGAEMGRTLALAAAGLVAFGFLLSHGIPAETARTKPYWGDGSADALQWLGVGLIWVCCGVVGAYARELPRGRVGGRRGVAGRAGF